MSTFAASRSARQGMPGFSKTTHTAVWRNSVSLIAATFTLFISVSIARGADGDLDPTFGNGGKVVTDFNNSTDWVNRVAVQPDGKIVAIGVTHPSHKGALARYNPDGTLDTTF